MRKIEYIAVHCTATHKNATIKSIQNYWRRNLGWKNPGYHIIVKRDGSAKELLSIDKVSNGVRGYNSKTINISYIGGIDENGKPQDNRTEEQKETLLRMLKQYKEIFPNAIIQGHRDFPNVKKACPSFDAKNEYKLI